MFQAAYESAWHHPGAAWAGAIALVVAVLLRRPALRGVLLVLAAEIALDAFFSAPFAPKLPGGLGTAVAILFVILGDYRYFVLVEMARLAPSPSPSSSPSSALGLGPLAAWLRALPWAFVVPLAQTAAIQLFPRTFADERRTYLVYELLFFALALAVRVVALPRRFAGAPDEMRAWAERLTHFEMVQYALWALADVLILSGVTELGYLLRIVPNVAYYAGFVAFAWRSAPARFCDRVD